MRAVWRIYSLGLCCMNMARVGCIAWRARVVRNMVAVTISWFRGWIGLSSLTGEVEVVSLELPRNRKLPRGRQSKRNRTTNITSPPKHPDPN
jgi:hypothetical protein